VFGRFARGEQARNGSVKGSGLGLALVEEHMRLHGGRVHVDDAVGGGARFVVELPIRGIDP
jgi:signal transduction histidine kinase